MTYADFQLPLTKLPAMWITRHHDSRSRKFLQHNHQTLLLKTLNNITVKISESYITMSVLLPDEVSTKIHILSTCTVYLLCMVTIIYLTAIIFFLNKKLQRPTRHMKTVCPGIIAVVAPCKPFTTFRIAVRKCISSTCVRKVHVFYFIPRWQPVE